LCDSMCSLKISHCDMDCWSVGALFTGTNKKNEVSPKMKCVCVTRDGGKKKHFYHV
jgi:hypothetical protein